MDGKLALMYVVIIALGSFFYASDESFDRVKHALAALMAPPVEVVRNNF
jgi:hypothetical protein